MLTEALQKVVRTLDKLRVPYALIGGLALAARGVVRATRDVDLLVDWSIQQARSLAESLNDNGLPATLHKGAPDDPVAGLIRIVFPAPVSPVKCDVLLASAAWQKEAVRNASPVRTGGLNVRVVQAADLFLLKLHAGGPMDLLDAARLLDLQTEDERSWWKERAARLSKSKAFAGCLRFLRQGG